MAKESENESDLSAWLRVQEELAQLVAHDMRNPLQAIMANASFLDDSFHPTEQEVRETASDIRSSSEALLRLIENGVAIARLESPASAMLARAPVSLLTAAEAGVERLATAAASAGVTVTFEGGEDSRVMADPQLLELMVQNLVANAIQHSRRRSAVQVRVEREGAHAAVTLVDPAPPFGAFEQHFTREAQIAIKFKADGRYSRGLGLYLVGLVSRAFGGTIEPSRDGARSVLRVWFPVA